MPLTMKLCENGRVIYVKSADPLSLLDFTELTARQRAIMDQATRPIHKLSNMVQVTRLPTGLINNNEKAPILHHINAGMLVIIGTTPIHRVILEAATHTMDIHKTVFFDTEAEGWGYLRNLIAHEDLDRL